MPRTSIRRPGCSARPRQPGSLSFLPERRSASADILPPVRRGIFGGTFDPIHIAHLAAAEAAYHALDLDVVSFVPTGSPWQKADRDVSSAAHRLAMTGLGIGGVDYFTVDDREIVREGPTYTIDTLDELADDEVTLILGADSAVGIPTWHRGPEVLQRVRLAVVPRPGTSRDEVEAIADGVHWIAMPELDISGRRLRAMRASGLSIRFLVPDAVLDYIDRHDLYV